jgi:hypothetical protein
MQADILLRRLKEFRKLFNRKPNIFALKPHIDV